MRTNLGQAEDRKRTREGPHRQKVQLYRVFNIKWNSSISLIRYMVYWLSLARLSLSLSELRGLHDMARNFQVRTSIP